MSTQTTRRRAPTYGDDQLHTLQRNTFRYFWQETNPANGLIPDNTAASARLSASPVWEWLSPAILSRSSAQNATRAARP